MIVSFKGGPLDGDQVEEKTLWQNSFRDGVDYIFHAAPLCDGTFPIHPTVRAVAVIPEYETSQGRPIYTARVCHDRIEMHFATIAKV